MHTGVSAPGDPVGMVRPKDAMALCLSTTVAPTAILAVVTASGASIPVTIPASIASFAVAIFAPVLMLKLSMLAKMASKSLSSSVICHGCVPAANSTLPPAPVLGVRDAI